VAEAPQDDGLAIVIPAYKSPHLAPMLESFAAQTDQRFRIYVADDGSPEPLEEIVAPYRERMDLVYHRFPENLGGTSLVAHWHRAIELSTEPWIWLFSDDDVVSPDCVAAFWNDPDREQRPHPLIRFNAQFIDNHGHRVPNSIKSDYPRHQSWHEHMQAFTRPHNRQLVMMQNIIFRRSLYHERGGFKDFSLGIWVDCVTWPDWAREGGILTLRGGVVSFRIHAGGYSGNTLWGRGDRIEFIRISVPVLQHIFSLYDGSDTPAPRFGVLNWFARIFRYGSNPLNRAEAAELRRSLAQIWPQWPVLRDVVFWWHACRPQFRYHPMVQALLGRAPRRHHQ
jgi:glycosyltransferase involved in cell wall biosynthesis